MRGAHEVCKQSLTETLPDASQPLHMPKKKSVRVGVTLRATKRVAVPTNSSVHTLFMHKFGEERRRELLREAERRRLARTVHEARKARAKECSGEGYVRPPDGRVDIRWGLLEDEPKIADILELNGMPRWVAYEERFIAPRRRGRC